MESLQEIEARRNAILEQMRSIRFMKKGTINEQYLKVLHKGKTEPVLRGPYYVISRREDNKTVSKRLNSDTALERARKGVEEYKRFAELCREYERLTEKLGEIEQQIPESEWKKKRSRSSLNRTKK